MAGLVAITVAVLLFALALGLDAFVRLPITVQMAIWAPLTVGGVLYALRFYKTLFLYGAYNQLNDAPEEPKP